MGFVVDYLPIFLKLQGRPCVVVGGGKVAARKARLLCDSGAHVTVVAPELCPELEELVVRGMVHPVVSPFNPRALDDCVLVVAATNQPLINRRVSDMARERGIPVNVVDDPLRSTFIVPAIVDRSPLIIAISSSGAAPLLARLLRARLETLIPAAYGRLAAFLGRYRDRVKTRFPSSDARRRFWESVLQGPVPEKVFTGREHGAVASLEAALAIEQPSADACGEIYLIGGGPGDPDLLTFRALRLLQQAEVVVYDRLVSKAIVDLARRDAERIYVGKRPNHHALPQRAINELLVSLAKQGKRVARLKGGDPFIFGRGGEEIEAVAASGIPFQVVPGITAASGCAAYAGIPLTHRDYAQSCVFVTGHMKDGILALNWEALAQPCQTIVVYMGLQTVDLLCRGLVAHGLADSTPAAVVERGTTADHRVLTATLATLTETIHHHNVRPPALFIIGQVVTLRESLDWFNVQTAEQDCGLDLIGAKAGNAV